MPDNATDMLRIFLAERDVACPACAYNLRALTTTRCPECNQELKLQVGLAEPRIAWFITGLVGVGMGFGFSALLVLYGVYHGFFTSGGGNPGARFIAPVLVGATVGAALLGAWLRARRHLGRRPAEVRWTLALLAAAAALACPIWFIIVVP